MSIKISRGVIFANYDSSIINYIMSKWDVLWAIHNFSEVLSLANNANIRFPLKCLLIQYISRPRKFYQCQYPVVPVQYVTKWHKTLTLAEIFLDIGDYGETFGNCLYIFFGQMIECVMKPHPGNGKQKLRHHLTWTCVWELKNIFLKAGSKLSHQTVRKYFRNPQLSIL